MMDCDGSDGWGAFSRFAWIFLLLVGFVYLLKFPVFRWLVAIFVGWLLVLEAADWWSEDKLEWRDSGVGWGVTQTDDWGDGRYSYTIWVENSRTSGLVENLRFVAVLSECISRCWKVDRQEIEKTIHLPPGYRKTLSIDVDFDGFGDGLLRDDIQLRTVTVDADSSH